jgi:hypothetical protein
VFLYFYTVDVGEVADVSAVHAPSVFSVYPEDGRSTYLQNVGNFTHIHTV